VLQILQGLIRPESDETAPKFKRILLKRNKASGNPGFFFLKNQGLSSYAFSSKTLLSSINFKEKKKSKHLGPPAGLRFQDHKKHQF
jgi:hypothetical protein